MDILKEHQINKNNILSIKDFRLNSFIYISDFHIMPGEIINIFLERGSYRTSFLENIIGLKKPFKGNIFLFNKDINMQDNLHKVLLYFNILRWTPLLSGHSSLKFILERVAELKNNKLSFISNKIMQLANELNMDYSLDVDVDKLNGFEKQKLSTIVSLSVPAVLILLEDPFLNFEQKDLKIIEKRIDMLLRDGSSILVLSEHKYSFIKKYMEFTFEY